MATPPGPPAHPTEVSIKPIHLVACVVVGFITAGTPGAARGQVPAPTASAELPALDELGHRPLGVVGAVAVEDVSTTVAAPPEAADPAPQAEPTSPPGPRAEPLSRDLGPGSAAAASYFGPGLFGHGTACGQILTTALIGVAHRTLPCGSLVTLRYGPNQVTVPVVDRGPYVYSREFDLTYATKLALGCPDLCSLTWSR